MVWDGGKVSNGCNKTFMRDRNVLYYDEGTVCRHPSSKHILALYCTYYVCPF